MMALSLTGLKSFLAEYAIWRLFNYIQSEAVSTLQRAKHPHFYKLGTSDRYKANIDYYMKNEQVSRTRLQLTQHDLDPLQTNELIVEQRIFLPIIISENEEPKVYPLIFKIIRDKNSDTIIIYILSEVDLYFLYKFKLSYEEIVELNSQFKLSLKKTADFVELLRSSLDDVQNHEKQGVVEITSESEVQFVLRRNVAGKSHIVLRLYGHQESQEVIKTQVAYRYGALRQRIQRKEERIQHLREMVKQKYPHLLKSFKQI